MKLETFKIIACCLFTSAALAADPGLTDTQILIGGHTLESGAFAAWSPTPRAATAYFDKINADGGVAGRKIKYLHVDTQADFTKSAAATRKLVEVDKVFAMFESISTAHQAVYKYLIANNVPDMEVLDGSSEYDHPVHKNLFVMQSGYQQQGQVDGEFVTKKFKGKKACFLLPENALGEDFLKGVKESIETYNKTAKASDKVVIGAIERVARDAPQANTQVLSLKKDQCDVVLNATYGGLCPNSMTYASSQGFKPQWIVFAFNTAGKFLDLLPEGQKDGIVSTANQALNESFGTPGWNDFKDLMTKNDIPVSMASIQGYYGAELFVEALKRAGKNLSRESLIAASESMTGYNCGLCLTPVSYSSKVHWAFEKPVLVEVKNGKWTRMKDN